MACGAPNSCSDRDLKIGSLRFEGSDFTFWARHAAFVEVYSTEKIRHSEVPEVAVTFGYPRINGRPPKLKSARVVQPGPGEPAGSPDCATAVADGERVVVAIGPMCKRRASDRNHALDVEMPPSQS